MLSILSINDDNYNNIIMSIWKEHVSPEAESGGMNIVLNKTTFRVRIVSYWNKIPDHVKIVDTH